MEESFAVKSLADTNSSFCQHYNGFNTLGFASITNKVEMIANKLLQKWMTSFCVMYSN